MRRLALSLITIIALASCGGGGGGGSSPPPAQGNRAPSFTSAAASSIAENTATAFYTAAASDPDGQTVSFSIAGGADSGRFAIDANSGALRFTAAPDFETPADANADNVYEVTLGAFDGALSASLALRVTVTDVTGQIAVRRVATGFSQPLFLTGIPDNSGRVLVLQKSGLVRILNPATGAIAATPFLDVSASIDTAGERGLLGLALAPNFTTSGTIYAYVINTAGDSEVRRYQTFANDRDRVDPNMPADVILVADQPAASNHKGGWLAFGANGLLHLALGDGGATAGNSQNLANLLGKIIRIDIASDAFPSDPLRDYAIPPGNVTTSGAAPEIWHYGLRNPFRASFDRAGGALYIGDVGEAATEEINLVRPSDGPLNFGWPTQEGNQGAAAGLSPPVAQYAHGTGAFDGNSITGGYVYRGPAAALRGAYVFGDFVRGRIWSIPASSFAQGSTLIAPSGFTDRTAAFAPDIGAIGNISSFGEDQSGNLYIVDFDGEIFQIFERE